MVKGLLNFFDTETTKEKRKMKGTGTRQVSEKTLA